MIGLRHTDDCGCNGVSVSPVALMGRECDCRIAKGVWEYWFGGMIELWVCSKYITHMVERKRRRSEFKVWELENALCKNFLIFRLKVRRRLRNLQVLCAEKFSALFKTQLRNPTGKCRRRVVLQIVKIFKKPRFECTFIHNPSIPKRLLNCLNKGKSNIQPKQ